MTLRSVIPVVATGGHCDIGECHSRCGHWGRCDIVGVIPIVATGGAVTAIISIGLLFPLWPLGGAVTLESVIPIVATGGAVILWV